MQGGRSISWIFWQRSEVSELCYHYLIRRSNILRRKTLMKDAGVPCTLAPCMLTHMDHVVGNVCDFCVFVGNFWETNTLTLPCVVILAGAMYTRGDFQTVTLNQIPWSFWIKRNKIISYRTEKYCKYCEK